MGAADRSQHPSGSLEAAVADAITITERIMARIGGMITDAEAKTLIRRKHHDLVAGQLQRYLSRQATVPVAPFRTLVGQVLAI
jgi:hypothetical protein